MVEVDVATSVVDAVTPPLVVVVTAAVAIQRMKINRMSTMMMMMIDDVRLRRGVRPGVRPRLSYHISIYVVYTMVIMITNWDIDILARRGCWR